MTTQSTAYPDTNVLPARKPSTESRFATDAIEAPELKVKVQQMVDTGRAQVTEWKAGLQDGIGRKPIQSVLVAAAVGAVIGLIVGRLR